jgi:aminopeptidase N
VIAAQRLSEGDYTARVPERGPPFLRAVAHAFNTMTVRLQTQDRQRRDLMADIAHELRTPLSVMQGQLEGLLDGSLVVDGLAVDTDLRWTLLAGLAKNGRADTARIDAELARDNTISGQEHAAACRALRPAADAKAEAWEIAMVRDDVPNETQRSVVLAFQVYGQDELLLPYVEKYLTAAETMWEEKGKQRAATALEFIFPRNLISQGLVDRVDQWLESSPANPAAKRYVREGRADVVRALAAQQKDAQA